MKIIIKFTLIILALCLRPATAFCSETHEVEIKLENHIFTPSIINVPSGKKIKLIINNMDSTMDEFESIALKRERILPSKTKTNIILAPLRPGRYDFIGEFHQESAKGTVVVE